MNLSMEFLPRGCNVLAKCFATRARQHRCQWKKKTNENLPIASPRQFYVKIEPDVNDKKLLPQSTDS